LTLEELKIISRKRRIELEIITHGALCYSFSGLCLFSSFLGGMSANRGQCRQPCRRIFKSEEKENYFFSLKDNQQIEIVPELMKIGISSLKVEGRMKSAEYVNRVARAYRLVIDDPNKLKQAKQLLSYDMGREKTSYFLGGNVSNAITENPFIGIHIGEVTKTKGTEFSFTTSEELKHSYRIRVQPQNGMDSKAIKLKTEYGFTDVESGGTASLNFTQESFKKGDKVFLIGAPTEKFRTKFQLTGKKIQLTLSTKKKQNILSKIGSGKQLHRDELFIRINSLRWLRKLYLDKFDQLILNLTKSEWRQFDLKSPFMRKNIHKFIVELPKFIPEDDVTYYRDLCLNLSRQGINNFMLSHISQKLLLPNGIRSSVNENVYALNDAAIQFLKEDNTALYIYPYEFDFENLVNGKDRNGIVPLYFYPELFHSRIPVNMGKLDSNGYSYFKDRDHSFRKIVRDGVTIVIPELPVSLFQYKDDIHKKGFRRFLIDLSYVRPTQNTFNRLQTRYKYSEAEQPGYGFNFKLGLS
ncbi:MAG: U32 family peptidase, partial [FCB group bacterium]|nr:U32 family peptidase [FCB group bacterium]